LRARFTSRPAGSTATLAFTGAKTTFTGANAAGNELLPARSEVALANLDADATETADSVGFVPDVNGTYGVEVWVDLDEDGLIDADEDSDTADFVVAAAPTAITVSRINSTTTVTGTSGALVKLTLTNAAGAASGLSSAESITIDPDGSSADITLAGDGASDTATNGAAATATYTDFVGGVLWLNVDDDGGTAGTITVTLTGVGGDITALTGQFTITTVAADNSFTGTFTPGTTGNAAYGATVGTATADDAAPDRTVPLGSSSITYTLATTAGLAALDYTSVNIADNSGRVTGSYLQEKTGLAYDIAVQNTGTAAAGTGSFSVSLTSTAIDQKFTITAAEANALAEAEIVSDTIDMDGGSLTVSPSTSITAAPAGSVTYSVLVKDQFGRALTSGTVTMTISGRNATTASTQQVKTLDSTGRVSFTVTDAPAAGVTTTADTVTFTALDSNGQDLATTAAITWSAQTAGSVVLTGGNTTAGVDATTPVERDIAAGTSGATGNTYGFTATVKDAAGNLLAGTPVTWTISGTGAAVLSTSATTYTNASGVASGTVYGWIAGTYTVTATAGGKSGTGTITFAQTAAGEERVLSATVSGSVITAKVVDRFGNPVRGVSVYATRTGTGYFGTGATKVNSPTGVDGTVEFVIAGGDAEVTLTTYDTTVVGAKGSGQTCAAVGKSDCATTATAFTASAAGTSTTAETGVGASFDAAGVSLVKVSVSGVNSAAEAATEAAVEATDAANSAYEAAVVATETAEAAVAAAEEAKAAADAATAAVEALATEVSTLLAGLKTQLTTLTNTVAKILRRVKA
jgi:hypothetical protein